MKGVERKMSSGIGIFVAQQALCTHRSLSPVSDGYRRFDGAVSTSAALRACKPDELSDRSDWPDFEW